MSDVSAGAVAKRPCPMCGEEIQAAAIRCRFCGETVGTASSGAAGRAADDQPDSTGGLIPYKNPSALIAYYLGVFSIFPVLGLLLAVPALILGIKGLRYAKAHPTARGKVHAWIGILAGALFTLIWGAVVILAVIGLIVSASRRR